jgi:cytochrome c peroxidase
LRLLLANAGVTPLSPVSPAPEPLRRLGQALFFDKILSGNRDIGCSTCHNPVYHTSDLLMLSIGTGGHRPGGSRQLGTGSFTTRHATDLFNRGQPGWRAFMWDGRVGEGPGGLETPLGAALPAGLSGPLAAQALLPLVARVEMRGHGRDELAALPDSETTLIFDAIVARLQAIPGYDSLFRAAFPAVPPESIAIAHVANAIAAFIAERWRADDSPFDRYLAGDNLALNDAQRRGAELFFGRALCATCHRGPLLTDQQFHNTGIPVLGPGIPEAGPDIGRAVVSGLAEDRYRFRTPPLRNASLTSPYTHNGSLRSFEAVIRHYQNATASLSAFDTITVDPRLRSTLDLSPARVADILTTLDPILRGGIPLTDGEVTDLAAFLRALTDPASGVLLGDVPPSVPSGLSVLDQ